MVVAKPSLDFLVELGNLLVKHQNLPHQCVHQPGGQLLAGQTGALAFSGLDGGLGEPAGADDVAVAQPGLQSLGADPANGGRGLVAGQQDERARVGQIQLPFQAGEDAGQLGSQAVDRAGVVGDQVHAPARENPEVDHGVVAGA